MLAGSELVEGLLSGALLCGTLSGQVLLSVGLDDLPRALGIVDARLPKNEAHQYRKCIFTVAKTVAMAAHEGEDASAHLNKAGLLGRVADWVSAQSGEQIPANISGPEKAALQKVLQCLKDR